MERSLVGRSVGGKILQNFPTYTRLQRGSGYYSDRDLSSGRYSGPYKRTVDGGPTYHAPV